MQPWMVLVMVDWEVAAMLGPSSRVAGREQQWKSRGVVGGNGGPYVVMGTYARTPTKTDVDTSF